MKVLLLLLGVYIAIASGFPSTNEIPYLELAPSPQQNIRINGGVPAEEGEFPWQVSIELQTLLGRTLQCGGSILNENYIITAAKCVASKKVEKILVVAGTNKIAYPFADSGQQIHADAVIVHPHYDVQSGIISNDIALIHLETPLVLDEKVQPVVLPEQMATVASGTECTISGWGAMNNKAPYTFPNELLKATVPIMDDDVCRSGYGITHIGDSMICAGLDEGGIGACVCDFGGPMVCDGVLYGISSWNNGCGRYLHQPTVHTEVAYFRDWIDANAV